MLSIMRKAPIIYFVLTFYLSISIVSCSIFHKNITVTGKAVNVKDGAMVETDDGNYLINKSDKWDETAYGKKVSVSGYLVVKTHKQLSTPERQVQESVGKVKIIKNARWTLVE